MVALRGLKALLGSVDVRGGDLHHPGSAGVPKRQRISRSPCGTGPPWCAREPPRYPHGGAHGRASGGGSLRCRPCPTALYCRPGA